MTVEHAGIDQPDRRHDQGKLPADRACSVVAVELLRIVELERRMHEHEQAEPHDLGPERLEFRRIEEQPVHFRGDHHAGQPNSCAQHEFAHGLVFRRADAHARRR